MFWKIFWKHWRKWISQKKENEILMFDLAQKLAPLLSEKLNGVSKDHYSCYTVKVIDGTRNDGSFVTFKIERDIEGHTPFNAGFVMLEKIDFTHHHYILELTEHEKDKLGAEEYRKLKETLLKVFGLYEIKQYDCDSYGQEINFHC